MSIFYSSCENTKTKSWSFLGKTYNLFLAFGLELEILEIGLLNAYAKTSSGKETTIGDLFRVRENGDRKLKIAQGKY